MNNLKPPSKGMLIGRRHQRSTESGGLILPDINYLMGTNDGLTETRLVDVISVASDVDDIMPGDTVAITEMEAVTWVNPDTGEQSWIDPTNKFIQLLPREKCFGMVVDGKVLPLDDYVFIKEIKEDNISSGGIYLPDIADRLEVKGIVIDKGKDCKYLNIGDKVLFLRGWEIYFHNGVQKFSALRSTPAFDMTAAQDQVACLLEEVKVA